MLENISGEGDDTEGGTGLVALRFRMYGDLGGAEGCGERLLGSL
jgi:hypothetical protein